MNATAFYLDRLQPLVDAKITHLVRTGVDEFGDEFFGLKLKCADGKSRTLILLRDDEGNGPGSFELIDEG